MSPAAKSIYYYSFYLFLEGILLALVPNLKLQIGGFSPTDEEWIRVLGVYTIVVGIYYYQSSSHEQRAFFQATVTGRMFFFIGIAVLFFLGLAEPALILVGTADVISATWTLMALRDEETSDSGPQ